MFDLNDMINEGAFMSPRKALNCTIDDIMEFIPEDEEKEGKANDK